MQPPLLDRLRIRAAEAAAATGLWLLGRAVPHLQEAHRSWIGRRAMRQRFGPRARHLAGFMGLALHWWQNREYDPALNGEVALLRKLAPFAPATLFDVGANVGDWTLAAHAALPGAAIHAFELDPDTAATLRRRLPPGASAITVNDCGLSDAEGAVEIATDPGGDSTRTQLLSVALPASAGPRKAARVTTGDAYVAAQGIARIDLLKLDVEGAEWQVLDGFRRCFAAGMIQAVQFEYGQANLHTRRLLADFDRFFAEQGFVLGKLYPEGVAFKPYDLQDEDFIGPNYVALRADRADLVAALRCPPLAPL
jgi:FkbM family methyltransferase